MQLVILSSAHVDGLVGPRWLVEGGPGQGHERLDRVGTEPTFTGVLNPTVAQANIVNQPERLRASEARR